MGLDINTPRGQETLAEEREAIRLFENRFPLFVYMHTPKDRPAVVDGMVFERSTRTLRAVAETKCRQMTVDTFLRDFEAKWLITAAKLYECRKVSTALCVPMIGLLYLVPSKTLLVQRIFDSDGDLSTRITKRRSETQRTVNGGTAERMNAYVSVVDRPPGNEDETWWLPDYDEYWVLQP